MLKFIPLNWWKKKRKYEQSEKNKKQINCETILPKNHWYAQHVKNAWVIWIEYSLHRKKAHTHNEVSWDEFIQCEAITVSTKRKKKIDFI